jgi:integrase
METALARIPDGAAGELVTVDDRAGHYERRSRADRTWGQYQSVWRLFSAWCNGRGLEPMPASLDTLKGYLTSLADEGRAVATINTYLAAICSAHSIAGYPLDRAPLKSILKGIRRGAKPQRQVAALVGVAIRKMLDEFRLAAPADARDGLILALGFAGAMRRSELAGLDWQEQGSGTGYLERVDGGLKITLVESKRVASARSRKSSSHMRTCRRYAPSWMLGNATRACSPASHCCGPSIRPSASAARLPLSAA